MSQRANNVMGLMAFMSALGANEYIGESLDDIFDHFVEESEKQAEELRNAKKEQDDEQA